MKDINYAQLPNWDDLICCQNQKTWMLSGRAYAYEIALPGDAESPDPQFLLRAKALVANMAILKPRAETFMTSFLKADNQGDCYFEGFEIFRKGEDTWGAEYMLAFVYDDPSVAYYVGCSGDMPIYVMARIE